MKIKKLYFIMALLAAFSLCACSYSSHKDNDEDDEELSDSRDNDDDYVDYNPDATNSVNAPHAVNMNKPDENVMISDLTGPPPRSNDI